MVAGDGLVDVEVATSPGWVRVTIVQRTQIVEGTARHRRCGSAPAPRSSTQPSLRVDSRLGRKRRTSQSPAHRARPPQTGGREESSGMASTKRPGGMVHSRARWCRQWHRRRTRPAHRRPICSDQRHGPPQPRPQRRIGRCAHVTQLRSVGHHDDRSVIIEGRRSREQLRLTSGGQDRARCVVPDAPTSVPAQPGQVDPGCRELLALQRLHRIPPDRGDDAKVAFDSARPFTIASLITQLRVSQQHSMLRRHERWLVVGHRLSIACGRRGPNVGSRRS